MMIISGDGRSGSWHVGEHMHLPSGYALEFSVYGDEQQWLLEAIETKLKKEGLKVVQDSQHLTPIL